MINEKAVKRYCCEDVSKIENYEMAVNSSKRWDCHHRLETHNSDGERRLVDLSLKELIALGMYYHRPASELIFLERGEHQRLHTKGKKPSEETRRKLSEHNTRYWKGKSRSEEAKKRMSDAKKGRSQSEESNRKRSETMKGKSHNIKLRHWRLVDGKRVWY